MRGSGKSLLADVVSEVNSGREMSRMSQPKDDDECRKRITAVALAGETLMLLDNIDRMLGSASLDAALTATSWTDRLLGASEMVSGIPLFATWYATGNNVILAADTARRTVHIRLESPDENPERARRVPPSRLAALGTPEHPAGRGRSHYLDRLLFQRPPEDERQAVGEFRGVERSCTPGPGLGGTSRPGATRKELATQADREAAALGS